jgi:tetratricopeptide (TPR) repeat protein
VIGNSEQLKLINAIENTFLPGWDNEYLIKKSMELKKRFMDCESDEEDLISVLIDTLSKNFDPGNSQDISVISKLCYSSMFLAFSSFFLSKHKDGLFKAVVLSLHLSIDFLEYYELSKAFCHHIINILDGQAGYGKTLVVLYGDLGISLARDFNYEDALLPLEKAVVISKDENDFESAARYGHELGRCYAELRNIQQAATEFKKALSFAEKLNDEKLANLIRVNILSLSKSTKYTN